MTGEKVAALIRYLRPLCKATKIIKNKQEDIEERRVEKLNSRV
jgi:hypothetical protein